MTSVVAVAAVAVAVLVPARYVTRRAALRSVP
jgi:hypothetical protein